MSVDAADAGAPWVGWSALLDGPEAGTDGSVASRDTLVQLSLQGSVLRVVDKAGTLRASLPLAREQVGMHSNARPALSGLRAPAWPGCTAWSFAHCMCLTFVHAPRIGGPQVWQASSSGRLYMVRGASQDGAQHTFVIRAVSGVAEAWLARLFAGLLAAPAAETAGAAAGPGPGSSNHFDEKTDKGSAELYFHYYGMLQHQQNMLQARPGEWVVGSSGGCTELSWPPAAGVLQSSAPAQNPAPAAAAARRRTTSAPGPTTARLSRTRPTLRARR